MNAHEQGSHLRGGALRAPADRVRWGWDATYNSWIVFWFSGPEIKTLSTHATSEAAQVAAATLQKQEPL